MDVRLQNAYVEVLLGNFMEVVKQNLLFQAQIEVNKNSLHEADDSVRRLKEISDSNAEYQKQSGEKDNKINHLENRINQLITERDNLKSSSGNNDSLKQEKDRLQNAVNDYMRQLKATQQEVLLVKSESQNVLLQSNNRIEELTKYIEKLEILIPSNKLKKVRLGETIQPETSIEFMVEESKLPIDINDDNNKSGGSF